MTCESAITFAPSSWLVGHARLPALGANGHAVDLIVGGVLEPDLLADDGVAGQDVLGRPVDEVDRVIDQGIGVERVPVRVLDIDPRGAVIADGLPAMRLPWEPRR